MKQSAKYLALAALVGLVALTAWAGKPGDALRQEGLAGASLSARGKFLPPKPPCVEAPAPALGTRTPFPELSSAAPAVKPPGDEGAGGAVRHELLATVLWDQPLSAVNQNAFADQDFSDYPSYSSYVADDFTNATPWSIGKIFVPGNFWNGGSSFTPATGMSFYIYADAAGFPAGYPGDGVTTPQWTITLLPGDPQLAYSAGTPGGLPSDVTLTLTTPISLPAGTWWFVWAPTMAFGGGGQYGRQASDTTNGAMAKWINPGGGFGYGTAWQNWSVLGVAQNDTAFRLESGCTPVPVNDGGFENGPPPASGWTEWANTACEWIMDPTGIWGVGPHSGSYALWTGGYCGGTPTTSYVEQSLTLPSSTGLQLAFWTVFYRPDADDPGSPDTFYVSVNGTPIFTKDMVQANNTYPNWVQQIVDLSAYSGMTVTLRIGIDSLGSATGNSLVDDVELLVCGACPTITLAPAVLPTIVSGVPYSQMITATGGTSPYTFAVTGGTLPAGLTLDPGGLLSGTPAFSGGYSFTVTATDSGGCTGEITYTGTAVKFYFLDYLNRSKFCVDTVTGTYMWNITSGPESGTNLTGTAKIFNAGAKVTNLPGDSNGSFSVTYDAVKHKASGWLITAAGHYVALSDPNTTNNPGACE